jgi:hypothetical protein
MSQGSRFPLRDGGLRRIDPWAVFENQLGSELVIEDDGKGALSGTYRSGTGPRPERATPYAVIEFCHDWAQPCDRVCRELWRTLFPHSVVGRLLPRRRHDPCHVAHDLRERREGRVAFVDAAVIP